MSHIHHIISNYLNSSNNKPGLICETGLSGNMVRFVGVVVTLMLALYCVIFICFTGLMKNGF